jgi:hypothetical protein
MWQRIWGMRDPHGTRQKSLCNAHGDRWPWRDGTVYPPIWRTNRFPRSRDPPLMRPQQQHCDRATPNPVKQYNNWNMCYSCGFDVEDGHTLVTCPFCKPTHQTGFTRANAQQYNAGGHDACQRGVHKTLLSMNWFA